MPTKGLMKRVVMGWLPLLLLLLKRLPPLLLLLVVVDSSPRKMRTRLSYNNKINMLHLLLLPPWRRCQHYCHHRQWFVELAPQPPRCQVPPLLLPAAAFLRNDYHSRSRKIIKCQVVMAMVAMNNMLSMQWPKPNHHQLLQLLQEYSRWSLLILPLYRLPRRPHNGNFNNSIHNKEQVDMSKSYDLAMVSEKIHVSGLHVCVCVCALGSSPLVLYWKHPVPI